LQLRRRYEIDDGNDGGDFARMDKGRSAFISVTIPRRITELYS
jgi:hypothetical protein